MPTTVLPSQMALEPPTHGMTRAIHLVEVATDEAYVLAFWQNSAFQLRTLRTRDRHPQQLHQGGRVAKSELDTWTELRKKIRSKLVARRHNFLIFGVTEHPTVPYTRLGYADAHVHRDAEWKQMMAKPVDAGVPITDIVRVRGPRKAPQSVAPQSVAPQSKVTGREASGWLSASPDETALALLMDLRAGARDPFEVAMDLRELRAGLAVVESRVASAREYLVVLDEALIASLSA